MSFFSKNGIAGALRLWAWLAATASLHPAQPAQRLPLAVIPVPPHPQPWLPGQPRPSTRTKACKACEPPESWCFQQQEFRERVCEASRQGPQRAPELTSALTLCSESTGDSLEVLSRGSDWFDFVMKDTTLVVLTAVTLNSPVSLPFYSLIQYTVARCLTYLWWTTNGIYLRKKNSISDLI